MEVLNKKLTLKEFEDYIQSFNFGSFKPNKLVIHHTWRPTKAQWKGESSMRGLQSYYQSKGWRAGPHLFIAEDGIWLFTPMNKTGIHAGKGNYRSIGIEVVGDYDNKKWDGATKNNAIGAIRALTGRLDINNEAIKFHRDYSKKSCPGYSITKEWLFTQLEVDPDVPNWENVAGKKSAKDIWSESINKSYLSASSKFNQNFTKGEAMIILARMFPDKFK